MDNINTIGWIGNIFFVIGIYLLGKKDIRGFYYNTVGNIFYVWQGIVATNHALYMLSFALILLNIKGVFNWRKYNEE